MAVSSIEDCRGPYGIGLSKYSFGANLQLKLQNDSSTLPAIMCTIAIQGIKKAIFLNYAKRQVREAMRSRNGHVVSKIHKAMVELQVFFSRLQQSKAKDHSLYWTTVAMHSSIWIPLRSA